MKKLYLLLVLLITASLTWVQAQVKTVHNPEITPTVTPDMIRAWGTPAGEKQPSEVFLNFEGLGDLDGIMQFYNGGTSQSGFSGHNYGIYFSSNAMSIINAANGGTGNFINMKLSNTALFFMSGSSMTMSVPAGFTGMLKLDYTSSAAGTVTVYDGVDGTGTMLASQPIQPLALGQKGEGPNGYYDEWKQLNVKFPGTARSVTFSCEPDRCAFDNMTVGSEAKSKNTGAAGGQSAGEAPAEAGFGPAFTTGTVQTDKGKWFLGGVSSLNFAIGGSKSKSDGNTVEGSESTLIYFDLIPKAGYYFIDNLVGGLFMDLELSKDKAKESGGYSTKTTYFVIGPFVRYYVPVCDKLIPFAEARVGFGVDNSGSKSGEDSDWSMTKENVFTYSLGGGATYFFNNVVGADMFLGYHHDAYKYKDSGDSGYDSKSIYNEFVIQLGIVVILGK